MADFAALMQAWPWEPIRHCPGRFVLRTDRRDLHPEHLIGTHVDLREYRTPAARDPVLVARFAGGGLLSYRHHDGGFTHTLNTDAGLARKLAQLGIDTGIEATPA